MSARLTRDDGQPKVAVLLATRNGRPWLPEQVDSIFAQRDVAVTLVVADDASTDKTWSWLEDNLGGRPGVSLFRHERASGSAGANFRQLFVQADIGDSAYVALADQDDVWAPDKLRRAIDHLAAIDAAGYSSSAEAFWPDGRVQRLTQSPRMRAADFLFEGAGQGCTFVLTRRLFIDVREFCRAHPEAVEALHYHDWLIYLLARVWARRWVFDDRSSIRYRQHEANEIGARRGVGAFERRLSLIRSGWFSVQVTAASRIYLLAGGSEPRAHALAELFARGRPSRAAWPRRAVLALRLARLGRRRTSDRLVLFAAALAGWL